MNPTTPLNEEQELEKAVQSILNRARTRALRDAPIYLSHVNEIESEVLSLIRSRETRLTNAARLRELESIPHGVYEGAKYIVDRIDKLSQTTKEEEQ